MRAFVRLREILATHKDLTRKREAMEKKYDAQFKVVFTAIPKLMKPPPVLPSRRIGFVPPEKSSHCSRKVRFQKNLYAPLRQTPSAPRHNNQFWKSAPMEIRTLPYFQAMISAK